MYKRKRATERDAMHQLILCKICHETLEEPIILPCHKTVCSKHVYNDDSADPKFKCDLCYMQHNRMIYLL